MGRLIRLVLLIAYLGIGVYVAHEHHYVLDHIHSIKPGISAALAILLWPLLLFDVNLHVDALLRHLPFGDHKGGHKGGHHKSGHHHKKKG